MNESIVCIINIQMIISLPIIIKEPVPAYGFILIERTSVFNAISMSVGTYTPLGNQSFEMKKASIFLSLSALISNFYNYFCHFLMYLFFYYYVKK